MSLSKTSIKWIRSLRQKKFRQSYGKFTVEGDKIVQELLQQQRYVVTDLYATADWQPATPPAVPVQEISPRELDQISQLATPNRVLAVVDLPAAQRTDLATGWAMYLDGIQSPSNLGAILRVADWFGFHTVIGGPGTADLYASKAVQASMGSFLRIHYQEALLSDVLSAQPGLTVYGAEAGGQSIFTTTFPERGLLVIGNEGQGISTATAPLVQHWLGIPRAPHRRAESLNAAVATGILCAAIHHRLLT